MKFLLDTNVVIAFQKRNHRVGERIRQTAEGDLVIGCIVLHELYLGAYRSTRVQATMKEVANLPFAHILFDGEDAQAAARIRADLKRKGTTIGPYDTLIAGQALARGLTLVTRNTGEFTRVEGLRVEDWEG